MIRNCTALALFAGSVGFGHHSLEASYDLKQKKEITGDVVGFIYRSPHTWVQVTAKDANGTLVRWAFEWESKAWLAKHTGLTGDDLTRGDSVTVTFSPPRASSAKRGVVKRITRNSDGKVWEDRLAKPPKYPAKS